MFLTRASDQLVQRASVDDTYLIAFFLSLFVCVCLRTPGLKVCYFVAQCPACITVCSLSCLLPARLQPDQNFQLVTVCSATFLYFCHFFCSNVYSFIYLCVFCVSEYFPPYFPITDASKLKLNFFVCDQRWHVDHFH